MGARGAGSRCLCADRRPLPSGALSDYPLSGLRVLDLSRVVSGPFAGRMMSDLGADVVKLEPPAGDVTRAWGQVRHGLSGFYTQQNAGKRNVSVDLRAPGGPELAARLARRADVVIENFRPGVMDRYGLSWEALSAANPGLVMLSISGFGQEGPWRSRQAYAPIVHAESGLLGRQARFDRAAPSDPMLSVADTDAGLHGLVAVLAALWLRRRSGRGQHIDLSMLDAVLATDDYAHHALDGEPIVRLGGEVWPAVGGPVMVAGEFRHVWRQASRTHGVADPTPAGAALAEKIACRRGAFASWVASFTDRPALLSALEAAGLAWADIRGPEDAFESPGAGRAVAEVDDRGGGRRRVVQSPYRFSAASSGVRGGAPRRGEHNAEVLEEWLGLGGDEVAALAEAGVLQSEEGDPVSGRAAGAAGVAAPSPAAEQAAAGEGSADLHVAVVGAGEAQAGELAAAEAVGRGLGRAGATLVCGGLGGVMEAACRGALAAGGRTVGILPGADRAAANPFVQVAVATGMGEMRNALVVRSADAVVAVGGAYGTLSEIALALRLGRPVVGLSTWGLTRGDGRPDAGVRRVEGPDEAVAAALAAARAFRG